jgi:hypothetical protein
MAELQERAVPKSAQPATDCAVGTRMLTLHLTAASSRIPEMRRRKNSFSRAISQSDRFWYIRWRDSDLACCHISA